MKVYVTKNKVTLEDGYIVNRGEYKVTPLEFEFTEEYTNQLVKKAIFVNGDTAIEQAIINNTCNIPHEVLDIKEFELRVYAYEVQDEELILRYSPTFAKVFLREGSYRGNTGSGEEITPTRFEQYEQALEDGLLEVNEKLEDIDTATQEVNNLDLDVNKVGSTTTIELTKKDGTEKTVEVNDGVGINYDWEGTSLGIKRDDEEEYQYTDLKGETGDCNFATFTIEDGELIMNKDEDLDDINFEIVNGNLEVIING